MKRCFAPADILLPDFTKIDPTAWAALACDQFTSEPEYWEEAARIAGGKPSALNLILPEVYLSRAEKAVPLISAAMREYLKNILVEHKNSMIYLERTQSDGRVRRGIVLAVDLDAYDYRRGANSLIRATEATVPERIPPRVAIRRDAVLELPHIMMLIDDPQKTVIEPLAKSAAGKKIAYDFPLMLGGGHVRGFFLDTADCEKVSASLDALMSPDKIAERYGDPSLSPLLFAVGDGNHSLATAKALYEEIKANIGAEAAKNHPARFALAEAVNIHDAALDFEPIYRIAFNADPVDLISSLKEYAGALDGKAAPQTVKYNYGTVKGEITIKNPVKQLTVATLQDFLDDYVLRNKKIEIDYIHGTDSVNSLTRKAGIVGFIFDGMSKGDLFRTVIFDGSLPRKTFSMGHARDKRYYLECRRIK